jgi:hypothetical protein
VVGAAVQAAVSATEGKAARSFKLTLVGQSRREIRVTSSFKNAEQAIEMIVKEIHDRKAQPRGLPRKSGSKGRQGRQGLQGHPRTRGLVISQAFLSLSSLRSFTSFALALPPPSR